MEKLVIGNLVTWGQAKSHTGDLGKEYKVRKRHLNVYMTGPKVLQIVNFSFLALTSSIFPRIQSLRPTGVGSEYTGIYIYTYEISGGG